MTSRSEISKIQRVGARHEAQMRNGSTHTITSRLGALTATYLEKQCNVVHSSERDRMTTIGEWMSTILRQKRCGLQAGQGRVSVPRVPLAGTSRGM